MYELAANMAVEKCVCGIYVFAEDRSILRSCLIG